MMHRTLTIALTALFLSGCAHYEWVKPTGNPATFGADNYNCIKNAMQAAPPVFQTYTSHPIHRAPELVRTHCVDNGHHEKCRTIIDQHEHVPAPKPVDLNAPNRNNLYNACMNAQGWVMQRVEDN